MMHLFPGLLRRASYNLFYSLYIPIISWQISYKVPEEGDVGNLYTNIGLRG